MATKTTLWQLRYRSPLSPTKGVDDVVIETDSELEADAKALAEWWLATKMPSPSTRFVYVRRLVVATAGEMRLAQSRRGEPVAAVDDLEKGGGDPSQAASRDDTPYDEKRRTPPGRVGA